jgi:predicted nuclease of predicted toxin-antitoxin system
MPRIMADHNVEGHLHALMDIWASPDWGDVWSELSCEVESFERLGISHSTPDTELWEFCQQHEIVLITGNRNAEGEDSLEAAIVGLGTPSSLPVVTIGDPDRLMRDRDYAERAAAQLFEYLLSLDNLRGAGRLYVP